MITVRSPCQARKSPGLHICANMLSAVRGCSDYHGAEVYASKDNSVDMPASMELSSRIFSTYYSLVSHSSRASSLTLPLALTLHP